VSTSVVQNMEPGQHQGHYALILRRAAQDVLDAYDKLDGHRPKTIDAFNAAAAELARVLPAPPADYDPRPYIAAHEWRYAKTRPANPHEYVVLVASSDPYEHLKFLEWVRRYGQVETWAGREYRYQEVDGWRYWALGPNDTIINRRVAPAPDPEQGELL
jgi:hypothetical protein